MALAQNYDAMTAYAALPESLKQAVLDRASDVRSEMEMYKLVASLAGGKNF